VKKPRKNKGFRETLMVRRRVSAVSNHVASVSPAAILRDAVYAAPQDEEKSLAMQQG
jgi:hypothetical protein